jgi:biopolymer transport protein ExbB
MLDFIFLQAAAVNLPDATAPHNMSIGETLLHQLQSGWYIYVPQLIMSILSVYIIIDRWMVTRKAMKGEANFISRIREYILAGKLEQAKDLSKHANTPEGNVIYKGLTRIGKPMDDIKKALENVGRQETAKLEKNVIVLATIAGVAPVFGFLGTVFGVITIFKDIAEAGSLQIGTVSEGLYLKMISSAVGLIVFMIAHIGYNTLVSRINKIVNSMENHAVEFLDILEEPIN